MTTFPAESRHTAPTAAQPRLRRPDGSPIRAVVVDDEDSLTDLLSMALRYEGWDVRLAPDGQKALSVVREFRPDVIVLDIMLPDIDGLQVLQRLRADGNQTPILFLTAKDSVDDRIAGLTVGGDDYVTKPFSLEELVARLRGLIRRSGMTVDDSADSHLAVGDLELDEDSYEVRRGGDLVELTATEFELLRYLMRNARRVVSKMQILDRVWSYDFGGKSSVVEIYISSLRKKIDAGRDPMIHTVRGVGYILKPTR
jgi:two-component system OmpR family response regulator